MKNESNKIPTGNVTFLFTDIEGSTKLAQDYPYTLQAALEIHNRILQKAVEANSGFVFEIVGDAFCCAFEKAEDAVKASVLAQINLAKQEWEDAVIKIRIGIHSGVAEWNGKRYTGYITLARTARVMSVAYGEQIIISNDVYELTKDKFNSYHEDTRTHKKNESDSDPSCLSDLVVKNISFRDLGERRLKDLKQPIRLYQLLSKGIREDFPPLKTLDARPNNLPVKLTNFIGRDKELKQVKEFLKNNHLLTLTGPGGAGKTRFALQAGADLIDDFNHGVWLVELAALSEPSFLYQSVFSALNLMEEKNKTPLETIISYLKDKELLLILDNCEHLIDASAALTEKLLMSCPKLKIIATSREALKCYGEQNFRVPSLMQPDYTGSKTPEQLTQYESVRLFTDRAKALNPEFKVTNENAPALAGICSRLDGMPLAIELAAARTKVLSLEKINERIEDRFNFLNSGIRTALPRQKTLKALIDWSYDLLSEKEKSLWTKLSIFSGGWTLSAAENICSDNSISQNEILDLLYQLSEKSVILYDETKERYSMLETIKQYGREKLENENELQTKLLNYFLELSKNSEPDLFGESSKKLMDILEADHNNIQSVIEWSLKNNETEMGAHITTSMGKFWYIRGYYSIGRKLFENVLYNLKSDDKNLKATLLNWSGELAFIQGEFEQAVKFCEESLSIFRQIGNNRGIAGTLCRLGNIYDDQGKHDKAAKFFEDSLKIFRQSNDIRGVAHLLNSIGSQAYDIGDFEKAREYYEESLELKRSINDKHGISVSLNNLGLVALNLEEYNDAYMYNMESLKLRQEMGDKRGITFALFNLGEVAFNSRNFDQSKKYFIESLELRIEMGLKKEVTENLLRLSSLFLENNQYSLAVNLLATAENLIESIGSVLNIDSQKIKDNIIENLYEHLSKEEFLNYFEEGKKLSLDEAVQLAVNS